MDEEKLIQKQLVKNMLLNFIAFTMIFSTLGIILYTLVEKTIYKSSDQELLNTKNKTGIIERMNNESKESIEFVQKDNRKVDNSEEDSNVDVVVDSIEGFRGNYKADNNEDSIEEFRKNSKIETKDEPIIEKRNEIMINPRIISIVRNEDGEIQEVNPNNENYYSITFDKNTVNTIYSTSINNEYRYRAINYQIQKDGKIAYVQLLINVDAEETIMKNFKTILVLSLAVSVGLALGASYVLSKGTLKPIISSWKKQTEFVQNASHELRTPLTIIQAKQELLLEEPESKIIEKTEDITTTLAETRRLTKLVKDLMELARSDTNKAKFEKTNVNADELIKKVAKPFKEIANSQNKKLKLELNYNKEIKMDVNKIHELLVIIIDNSIKYTEQGDSIIIKTEEKDGKLDIEITDTGIGVSNETIKHMFDRFYREDKARSRETGGSGLGLSIAKAIVTEHGGTIKARHNNPKGTIIEVKLRKS